MVRMCSWCGGYPAMQDIGVDECEICYYLPGHEGASDLVQIPASELARLQAIIDDIAAHLTVDPERNMFYLKLGRTKYGAFIKQEDYMDDFPFMVSLRPIAEMKAAALLAGTPAEDSDVHTD